MVDPKVKQILDALLARAEKVIDIDCLYVALYNQVTVELDFPLAVRKRGEGLQRLEIGNGRWASRPYQPSKFLPDYIFAGDKPEPVLIKTKFEAWLAANKLDYEADERPLSWLGIPLMVRGRVAGVIVIENCVREQAYDERNRDILSAMANRAAGALANARLVESLRAVNVVGQRLTSGIRLNVDQILELIYEQASHLMDTRNMYIALYDEGTDVVSFGLARQHGETVDVEKDEDWQPRKAGKGLTERVIRSRAPFCPQDVMAAYEEAGVVYVEPIPKSWLGVPMMSGDRVLGVIAVQNDDVENLYGPDDQAVLQTMADQAAVALANARLVESLRVVNVVGQRLTSGIRLNVGQILELIYEQASHLMDTRNMYFALYDEGTDVVSFGLARQHGETVDVEKDEDWQPRKAGKGLTERVIRSRAPFCPQDVKAAYEEAGMVYVEPIPKSWLGVPMMSGDRVLGVIAVQNDDMENLYGPDDQAVLQTMADQAAVALANARLVESLRVVNEVGQRLTSGIRLSTEGILELIYEQASQLMDTRNMYVALYDINQNELSFPVATYQGEREQWPSRKVDTEDESKGGLTEEVIRTKRPLCPPNVEAWFTDRNLEPAVKPLPKSWLGVPMMIEDRVLGVIAAQNDDVKNLYGPDDQAVLQTMAGQAAIAAMAIENTRLLELEQAARKAEQNAHRELQQAQRQAAAAERLAAINSVAAELAHQMNNLAGTIPGRVNLARERLDPQNARDKRIIAVLEGISADALRLLEKAKYIRESTAPETLVLVDVSEMLRIALGRVRNSVSAEFEGTEVTEEYSASPLLIVAPRNSFLSSLENLLCNAIEAMSGVGNLSVRSRDITIQNQRYAELTISDTGKGIEATSLPKIFDLFYTTKPEGMGFGLWEVKNLARSIEGEIEVDSAPGEGTTFRLRFPEVLTAGGIQPEVQAIAR